MDKFAEINRKHWNNAAGSYDSKPWQQVILAQVTREIQSRLEWIGVDWIQEEQSENAANHHPAKTVRVLDYACGPGLVSRALAPYATEFRGIDISENMVNEYNSRALRQGFSPAQMSATRGDLLASEKPSPSVSGPDFYNFDLAVVDLGFHHFEDPALATKRLVERLKPGKGVLLIIDFVQHEHGTHGKHGTDGKHGTHRKHGGAHAAAHHDGEEDESMSKSAAMHIVAHHGFAKETIESMLKDAGCVEVDYVVLEEPLRVDDEMDREQRTVFMIRGRRQD